MAHAAASATGQSTRSRLDDFLRNQRDEIIAAWTERLRALWPLRELSDSALVDQLPAILSRIGESASTGGTVTFGELPNVHAIDGLARGLDLDQVVNEYQLLRRTILDLWQQHVGPAIDVSQLRALDTAFDESIAQAAVRYARARERLLKSLDRISEAALGSSDLDAFLTKLMHAMVETTESVDTSAVLLRDGDSLHVRAAAGVEQRVDRGLLRIGEGVAGQVALQKQPLFLPNAAEDPRVKDEILRQQNVRALYAVPLLHDGAVIGVTYIGSHTAFDFSEEDKLLFRTMASRATAVIVQAQLVGLLKRTETGQRFLSEASKTFAESLDYEVTFGRIARLAVPTMADWCVVDLVEHDGIRRVSVAHTDAEKEQRVRDLWERYPPDPNARVGVPSVLRTGQLEFQPDLTDALLAGVAQDAEHLRLLRELGLRSYVVVPVLFRGRVLGAITFVMAESGRRHAEADVHVAEELARRAATALENARLYSEMQNAVHTREQVLAIVSHDLRNHLGVVAVGADLLARKASVVPEIRRPVESIQRTARTMKVILGDLLDMASIQAGRFSLERQQVPCTPMLNEAGDAHEPLARDKGVRLQRELMLGDIEVSCDRGRILQVLSNLLGNAIKFCKPGDSVTLRADERGREVLVAVRDTGPGIPPDELQSVFEAYRTIQRAGKTGTGLGLYIARGIMQGHGGRIWAESEVGAGTTVSFTLPRA